MTTKIRLLHDTVGIPTGAVAVTQSASDNTTKVATTAYVTTALANLADSAPSTLNTLNELAAALGDDANFSTTVTNSIATKLPLAGGTLTGDLTTNGDIIVDNSSGDPFLKLKTSAQEYVIRIDQSDSEKFQIRDTTNSATRMTIDTSGNVGIGVTPTTALHIDQPSNNQAGGLYIERNGSSYGLSLFVDSGGYGVIGGNGSFTPSIMKLDFSQEYVGIGVNPAYGLHIGDGKGFMVGPDNSHGTYISHTHENTINGGYGLNTDIADLWINYVGYQNGTSRFRDFRVGNGKQNAIIHVDGSSGNVGIGTDPAGLTPSGILHLYKKYN